MLQKRIVGVLFSILLVAMAQAQCKYKLEERDRETKLDHKVGKSVKMLGLKEVDDDIKISAVSYLDLMGTEAKWVFELSELFIRDKNTLTPIGLIVNTEAGTVNVKSTGIPEPTYLTDIRTTKYDFAFALSNADLKKISSGINEIKVDLFATERSFKKGKAEAEISKYSACFEEVIASKQSRRKKSK